MIFGYIAESFSSFFITVLITRLREIFLGKLRKGEKERTDDSCFFSFVPYYASFFLPLFFSHASRDILEPFFALIVFDFRPIKWWIPPTFARAARELHGELISPRWIRERLRLPSLVRNIPFPSLRNDQEAARPSPSLPPRLPSNLPSSSSSSLVSRPPLEEILFKRFLPYK